MASLVLDRYGLQFEYLCWFLYVFQKGAIEQAIDAANAGGGKDVLQISEALISAGGYCPLAEHSLGTRPQVSFEARAHSFIRKKL